MKLLFTCIAWLALTLCASAQVTFDAKTASVVNTTGTSLSVSFTMGTVSNGALVVPIWFANSTVPTLTVTYNGVAMTAISGTNTGTNGGCSCSGVIYGMLNPPSGSHTLSVTWTGANEAHMTAVSFAGVDQTSIAVAFPNGTFVVNNTSTASPLTVTVTSATNNQVVAAGVQGTSSFGAISGNTIAVDNAVGPALASAYNYTSGAATVSPTMAFSGPATWGINGTDVKAAGGGGGGTAKPRLMPLLGAGR